MTDNVKKFSLILNGALICVIVFLTQCSNPFVKTITKTVPGDTKFTEVTDTLYKDKIVYQPTKGKTYTSHDTVYYHDTVVRTRTDSTKAAVACFSPKVYKDTTKEGDVVLYRYDSLYMNDFAKHSIKIKNNRKTVENIMNPEKVRIWAGGQVGLGLDLKSIFIEPQLMLQDKSGHLYEIGFDVVSRSPMFGVNWRLGK